MCTENNNWWLETQIGSTSSVEWCKAARYHQGCTAFILNTSCGVYWRNAMTVLQSEAEETPICGLPMTQSCCAHVTTSCWPCSNGSKKPSSPKTYCHTKGKYHGGAQRQRNERGLHATWRENRRSGQFCLGLGSLINIKGSSEQDMMMRRAMYLGAVQNIVSIEQNVLCAWDSTLGLGPLLSHIHMAVNNGRWQYTCWCIRTVVLSKIAQSVMGGEGNEQMGVGQDCVFLSWERVWRRERWGSLDTSSGNK